MQDNETSIELQSLIGSFSKKVNIELIEGFFGSPGVARNAGLESAKGEWITFWDSDDYPDVLATLSELQNARREDKVIVTRFRNINTNTGAFLESKNFGRSVNKNLAVLCSEIGLWRILFHRSEIQAQRFENLTMGEDALFLSKFGSDILQFRFSNSICYNYYSGDSRQLTAQYEIRTRNTLAREKMNRSNPTAAEILIFHKLKISDLILERNFFQLIKYLGIIFLVASKQSKYFAYVLMTNRLKRKHLTAQSSVSIVGGFGNQLFQLAALISMKRFPEDYCNLEWGLGSLRLNEHGLPEISKLNLTSQYFFHRNKKLSWITSKCIGFVRRLEKDFPDSRKTKIAYALAKPAILLYFLANRKVVIHDELGYVDLSDYLNSKSIQFGYFQSYIYLLETNVRDEMLKILEPEKNLEYSKYLELSKKETPVVIHIRLGDYRSEDKFGMIGHGYISKALDILEIDQSRRYWLFSDEPEAAAAMIPEKIRSHVRLIDIKDTVQSFQVMRLGSDYIISNSTFSWWAAMTSYNHSARVCAPTPWFKDLKSPESLIPENWVKINPWAD